jgi:alcohol dehydrogenase
VPSCALVDPAASAGCPPEVTAASGLDALCHAIEALTGRLANPVTDLYALEAIRLIHRHLPAAMAGESGEARAGMALGALLAGLAFSPVGTAAVHACGYPLSGMWRLSHGLANALMLPAVTAFNESASAAYGQLRPLFGEDVAAGLSAFIAGLGVPTRLRDAGVARDSLRRMAEIAAKDERHLAANPRPVTAADLERLFEQAW